MVRAACGDGVAGRHCATNGWGTHPRIVGDHLKEALMIAIHAGNSVSEYDQAYTEVAAQRPDRCPSCGVAGRMTGFGRYPRNKPLEATPEAPHPVPVRRWRCGALA